MHVEISGQRKTFFTKIRNGAEAVHAGIGNAHAEAAAIAQGNRAIHTNIGRNGDAAEKSYGDIPQLNRSGGRERNSAGN